MNSPARRWLGASLVAGLLAVAAIPGAIAETTHDVCMSLASASLGALASGNFAAAGQDFSAATAQQVPAATVGQAWQSVQQAFGAYRGHGLPYRTSLRGQSVVVIRLSLAVEPLDFVVACDRGNKITTFAFLKPSVVAAPPPVEARVLADGVRIEPLAVPSPVGPLRGALTLPAGKGPFPAVVLVAGSGPNDMDETIGPNKPFRDIADGLAQAGIATLRYDKRTFDHAEAVAANPDFMVDDEVTDDALSALRLLAEQKQVDPRRVFVLGHSEGAMLAPRIAQRDPRLAGVIMLAAPARTLLEVSRGQIRQLAAKQGAPRDPITAALKANEAEQALLAKADSAHPPAGAYGGAPQSWWLSLHDYHQVAVAKQLTLPMLILQGGRDFQVSPTLDFDAWKLALARKSNVTFHLYPGLGHLFRPAGKTATVADYLKPGPTDSQVIHDIAQWIEAQPPNRH